MCLKSMLNQNSAYKLMQVFAIQDQDSRYSYELFTKQTEL